MEHQNDEFHRIITEIIEDMAEAEGRMRAARDRMNVPFLTDRADFASIVAHTDSALASAGAAIAEAHSKLHEP